MIRTLSILFAAITIFSSCNKETLINHNNSVKLEFSNDTIMFDTIFTSIGSITKELMVYNNNNFDITTDIKLSGSSEGHFRMNVDGESGNDQKDILIRAKDSIFIFLEVTIDPNQQNNPYLVSDSITFSALSNDRTVKLIAYGQDAYFHTANKTGYIINGNDTTIFPYHKNLPFRHFINYLFYCF